MSDSNNIVNTSSLTDEIAEIIRHRILNGEYYIGEKIKETEISSELRVSRTPVREAFKLLSDEGLIQYVPNRGCYAMGFTRRDIDDIYVVREALELIAVQWAAERIGEYQIREMQDQCDLMEFYLVHHNGYKALSMNKAFHEIIYKAAGSRFLAHVLRSYKEYVDQNRKTLSGNLDYIRIILAEHRKILNAISSGDVEAAKNAMSMHLHAAKKRSESVHNIIKNG